MEAVDLTYSPQALAQQLRASSMAHVLGSPAVHELGTSIHATTLIDRSVSVAQQVPNFWQPLDGLGSTDPP
jgi:hypothetical protein